MKKFLLVATFFFFISPCLGISILLGQPIIQSLQLRSVQGMKIKFKTLKKNSASVFIFLSPECTISQESTLALNKIQNDYKARNVVVYGVIPGRFYSDKSVLAFKKKYLIAFTILMDSNMELKRLLGATVTPEVFVLDSDYTVVYWGAIDNAYKRLGEKQIVTHRYLKDVMEEFVNHNPVSIKHTAAAGCLIE